MNRRFTTLISALGVALGGLAVTASPASAYSWAIGPLDTSTPGHVRGTITTDAPYVVVRLLSNDSWQQAASTQGAASGSFTFDLETWGLTTGRLQVETCTSEGAGCTNVQDDQTFEASDAVPEVVWPDGDPFTGDDFTVSATDSGGGYLWAQTSTGDGVVLPGDGTPTVLPAPADGAQYVYVSRCSEVVASCNGLIERPVTIDRPISADAYLSEPWSSPESQPIDIDATPEINFVVRLRGTGINPSAPAGLEVRASFVDANGVDVGGGWSGRYDLPRNDDWLVRPIGLTHLKSGQYKLRVTTTWGAAPDQRMTEDLPVAVTNPAPVISSMASSGSSVYPVQDGYADSVTLRLRSATWRQGDKARFEIRDAAGTVIRRLTATTADTSGYSVVWTGRTSSGALAPAGTYHVKGFLADAETEVAYGPITVTVVRKHLANRTWTRTVTPAKSYVRRYVGSCSTLRQPSLRGWSGSFGLYSNTKCRNGFDASWSESHHAINVAKPANLRRYLDVRVAEYGGAATSRPTSKQGLSYLSTGDEWRAATTLSAGLGTHYGLTRAASGFIHDRATAYPWVYWASFVSDGRRYDVKSFTVRVRYEALVND